jgi:hypothetical protein
MEPSVGRPRKRPASELTNEEALRQLFPKPVADRVQEEAIKARKKPPKSKDK